jgi:hypothetical protein
MVNISVVIPSYGSFFLENEHVGDAALTAAFFVDWFFKKTKIYVLDLKRISSLSTDTCATMRNTWTSIENHLLLSYTLVVPCNSHGL